MVEKLKLSSNLKPGGYIELHEFNLPVRCTEATAEPTPYIVQWGNYLLEVGAKVGFDFTVPMKLDQLLEDTGFTDITVRVQNWPVNTWAKGSKNKVSSPHSPSFTKCTLRRVLTVDYHCGRR